MKKSMKFLLLFMAAVLLFSGCGQTGENTAHSGIFRKVPEFRLPDIALEQSLEMATYMCAGRALVSGDTLFCMDFDENSEPVLASYGLENSRPDNFTILKRNCVPEFLCELKGRLYYINGRNNDAIESIEPGGGESRVIKEGPCDFLRTDGNRLYYCDGKNRLYAADPGAGTEQILLPEACFYPYVCGDVLIYQRASDEHLHMLELLSGTDTELTDVPSYAPVIWDGRLYCTVPGGIYSMGLDGLDTLKLSLDKIQGEVQYYLAGDELNICGTVEHKGIQSFNLRAAEPKDSFRFTSSGDYRMLEYAGEEYTVFSEYEAGGRFRHTVLLYPDSGELSFCSGEIH